MAPIGSQLQLQYGPGCVAPGRAPDSRGVWDRLAPYLSPLSGLPSLKTSSWRGWQPCGDRHLMGLWEWWRWGGWRSDGSILGCVCVCDSRPGVDLCIIEGNSSGQCWDWPRLSPNRHAITTWYWVHWVHWVPIGIPSEQWHSFKIALSSTDWLLTMPS